MSTLEKEVLNLILTDKEVKDKYEQQFFGFHLYYGLKIEYTVDPFFEEFEEVYSEHKHEDLREAVLTSFERINDDAIFQMYG